MKLKVRAGACAAAGLVLLALAPLPGLARATAAVAALLVAWPLALRPRLSPAPPAAGDDDEPLSPGLARCVRDLALWPLLGALPLLGLAALGLLGLPMSLLLGLWLIGLLACLVAGLLAPETPGPLPARMPPAAAAALALALAFLLAFVISRGAPLGPMDDAYDHLATIRHLVTAERLEMPGAFYAREVPAGLDPRKGVLHVGLALAARLARVDALTAWRAAPAVLALLAGLAFAGLALALVRRWSAAPPAVAGLLLFGGDPGRLVRGAYGGHWGLVVAWAGLALALSGGGWGAGLVAGLATAAIHAYSPAQLLAPLLGAVVAFRLAGRRAPAGSLSFIGGALLGALPVTLCRLLLSAHSGNPLHEQSMPWLLLPGGPVASPLEILRAWGPAGAVAALALVPLLFARRERTTLFLAGALLAPLGLLLNPWLFAFVGRHLGSVANKLLLAWEPALAVPALGLMALRGWRGSSGAARSAWLVGLLLLGGGLLPTLPGRAAFLLSRPVPSLPTEIRAATGLAADATPATAVIASDPMTAYALPALAGRRAIVTLQQHSPPGDDRALDRLAVTAALYSTCVPLEAALAAAAGEGADYLLVARQPGGRVDQFGNHPDPRNEARLARRFSERPDLLLEVAHREGACLYQIRTSAAGTAPALGVATADDGVDRPKALPPPGGVGVDEGNLRLDIPAAPVGPWVRGGEVSLPVLWTRRGPGAHYEEYSAHIRFENSAMPVLRGAAAFVSKPLRRIVLEKRAGGSYRARAVEAPFRYLCPTAGWEIGRAMEDTLRFIVPPSLLPGTYRLRVALERGTLYPVLRPADLLRDEDRFSGPVLGTLEIR